MGISQVFIFLIEALGLALVFILISYGLAKRYSKTDTSRRQRQSWKRSRTITRRK